MGLLHLRRSVPSASLRAALTPSYTLGCKRLLMSNTYYPALAQSNVAVHPTAVASFDGRTVVGADGTRVEADVVVLGTGFKILDLPVATRVYDGVGRSLADHWEGSPQAYLGTAVAGFPNFFNLLGPNLGTGHTSAFMILEAQLDHVLGAVSTLLSRGWSSLDVRPEAQASFVASVQTALRGTVYETGGCASYYHDANGRNSFSWPWSTRRLRTQVGHFDPTAYAITSPLELVR